MLRVALTLVAVTAAIVVDRPRTAAQADTAQQPAGMILGKVLDGVTGEPVAQARVLVTGAAVWRLTDSEGRFVFFGLAAGLYRVVVEKAGYAPASLAEGWSGANRRVLELGSAVPSAKISLAEGQRRGDVVVRVWKYAAVSGRLLDEAGEPIVGALVQAWPQVYTAGRSWFDSVTPASAMTDDRGVFRIAEAPAGRYVLVAPWLALSTPVAAVSPMSLGLGTWPLEVFRVLQTNAPGVPITKAYPTEAGGGLTVRNWRQALLAGAIAPPAKRGRLAYTTTFYPGVPSFSEAAIFELSSGAESLAGDLPLHPLPVCEVAGVLDAPGDRSASVTIVLKRLDATGILSGTETAVTLTDPSGAFLFTAVPPGSYVLEALDVPHGASMIGIRPQDAQDNTRLLRFGAASSKATPVLWSRETITVGEDGISNLSVHMQQGTTISGRLHFAGTSAAPNEAVLTKTQLELDRPDGRWLALQPLNEIEVDAAGEFRSIGLVPGRYLLRVPTAPPGWWLESATLAGQDISESPLDVGFEPLRDIVVTFTDRPSVVSGLVRLTNANIAQFSAVVMFPVDRTAWVDYGLHPRRVVATRSDAEGRYSIRALPAGEYWIAAMDEAEMADWQNPRLFESLSRIASRVIVAANQSVNVDLTRKGLR